MKTKWVLMLVGFLTLGVVLAGCAENGEEQAQEDVGEGIDEPEEDVGPAEEEIAPAEEDEVGGEEPVGEETEEGI